MSLAVSVALWVLMLKARSSLTVLILVTLPATLVHELAHWLVAFLLGARPSFPSVVPRKEDNGSWSLGSVKFRPGMLTAGVVALAPLLLLAPLAIWGLWFLAPGSVGTELARGLVFGFVAWGSIPSSTDWEISLRYPVGTTVALLALASVASAAFGTG